MQASLYTANQKNEWDDFVAFSRQGTFLFCRDYMDYHSDRFEDHSLVLRDRKDHLAAVLPASRRGDVVHSHGGLTYGGFLTGDNWKVDDSLAAFEAVAETLMTQGIRKLQYKTIPSIYHGVPGEEDRYGLFRFGARLSRRDVLTVIDYRCPLDYQSRRRRMLKKADRTGLVVRESGDFATFWPILTHNLQSRHDVEPVHNQDEIRLLADRFPENIRLFAAYEGDEMVAAAVVFVSRYVCHVQYNAASEAGKECGALDAVLDHVIEHFAGSKRFFDFGISTENGGEELNNGLVDYKEGFGGRTIVHDFYELALD